MSAIILKYRVRQCHGGFMLKTPGAKPITILIAADPSHQDFTDTEDVKRCFRRIDFAAPGKPVFLGSLEYYSDGTEPFLTWKFHGWPCGEVCAGPGPLDGDAGLKLITKQSRRAHAGKSWPQAWVILANFVNDRMGHKLDYGTLKAYAGHQFKFDATPYFTSANAN